MDLVNPGLVLGMCYASPDAGNDSEPSKKSILFAPLGRLFAKHRSAGSDTACWFHTRLVLVVEILEDGSAGPLYFVSNVDDDDDDDDTKRPPPLDQNDGDIPAMFRGMPHFTVAEVEGKCGRDLAPRSGEPAIVKLKVESTSKPHIVETGAVASHWRDTLPTALYPLNQAEG